MALIDLCPARNPRPDDMPIAVKRQFFFVPAGEADCLRPGSNPAHVTANDVPNLRQFVDTGSAKKMSQLCDSGIVHLRRAAGPVAAVMGRNHGPEFAHAESP